jgi:hypothetical protein
VSLSSTAAFSIVMFRLVLLLHFWWRHCRHFGLCGTASASQGRDHHASQRHFGLCGAACVGTIMHHNVTSACAVPRVHQTGASMHHNLTSACAVPLVHHKIRGRSCITTVLRLVWCRFCITGWAPTCSTPPSQHHRATTHPHRHTSQPHGPTTHTISQGWGG